jgi:membrane protein
MNLLLRVSPIFKEAAEGWIKHRTLQLGASLAFYATLSLAPVTILALAVAGRFFGEEAARNGIVAHIDQLTGRDGAIAIESLIREASNPRQSRMATAISFVLLVVAATGVFAELKDSLDTIFEVKRQPSLGLWFMARSQLLAFVLVVSTGCLLLVSLGLTAMLAALASWLSQWLAMPVWVAFVLDLVISVSIITLLLALIFKVLPDVTLDWRDVLGGAVFTAFLFMIGKFLVGLYIGWASVHSVYGAAGSVVVILMWTYYSSQVLFFGAELIRSHNKR